MQPSSLNNHIEEIDAYSQTLSDEASRYWQLHRQRFAWTAELIENLIEKRLSTKRILDIGNSFQTLLFEKRFPKTEIDTLGFLDHSYLLQKPSHHYPFDLNLCHDSNQWIQAQTQYDVISFLEVIEHLYTSPPKCWRFFEHF